MADEQEQPTTARPPRRRQADRDTSNTDEQIGYLRATLDMHAKRLDAAEAHQARIDTEMAALREQLRSYVDESREAFKELRAQLGALLESLTGIADKVITSQVLDAKFAAFLKTQEDTAAARLAREVRTRRQVRSVARAISGLLAVVILGLMSLLASKVSNKLGETVAPIALVLLLIGLFVFVWISFTVGAEHD